MTEVYYVIKKHLKHKIKFHRWYKNLSIRNYILIYRNSKLSETPDRHLAGISTDLKTPEYKTCKANQRGVQVPCSFQDANFKNNYMPSLPKMSALPSARLVHVPGFEALVSSQANQREKRYTPGKCFP